MLNSYIKSSCSNYSDERPGKVMNDIFALLLLFIIYRNDFRFGIVGIHDPDAVL